MLFDWHIFFSSAFKLCVSFRRRLQFSALVFTIRVNQAAVFTALRQSPPLDEYQEDRVHSFSFRLAVFFIVYYSYCFNNT